MLIRQPNPNFACKVRYFEEKRLSPFLYSSNEVIRGCFQNDAYLLSYVIADLQNVWLYTADGVRYGKGYGKGF